MPRSRRLIRLALALALAPACADETVDAGADEAPDEFPQLGGPARGLTIRAVEVNQGTAVDVVRDDQIIAAEERNARLIRNRDTLIRVHHVIDDPDTWIAREITGILRIQAPEGPELVLTRNVTVTGDSDPRRLDSTFYFGLPADDLLAGTEIRVELRETDPALDVSSLSEGLAATPVAPLEVEDTPLELRVVLVPVRYEYLDPPREPDITADDLALLHDQLLQQNPVQRIDLQIRSEPLVRTEQLLNLGSLLAPTREVRAQDGVPPNVYYHALVDVNGPSVSSVAGIAMLTDATKEDAGDRVAVTVYHKHVKPPPEDAEDQTPVVFPPTASARTFVHEIGHNQGFRHVACPNAGAAGPDPDYPHADGKIGVFGFGIRDYRLYTPTASHDYMSYCGNSWVSDWTWNKAFTRIEILTSWDSEGLGAAPSLAPLLVGLLTADGYEEWSVHQGPAPTRTDPRARIEYSIAGSIAASVPASVELLSDDATVLITAALPLELGNIDAMAWRLADRGRVIDPARVFATH